MMGNFFYLKLLIFFFAKFCIVCRIYSKLTLFSIKKLLKYAHPQPCFSLYTFIHYLLLLVSPGTFLAAILCLNIKYGLSNFAVLFKYFSVDIPLSSNSIH